MFLGDYSWISGILRMGLRSRQPTDPIKNPSLLSHFSAIGDNFVESWVCQLCQWLDFVAVVLRGGFGGWV
jgi:hypothetical protein